MCLGLKQPTLEDTMAPEQEDRIKQRAYEIWEREGRPHGRDDVHWSMAVQEIRAEDGWVDEAANSAGPMDDLSRQLGSAEASLAPEGVEPAPAELAPARKPRAKKAARRPRWRRRPSRLKSRSRRRGRVSPQRLRRHPRKSPRSRSALPRSRLDARSVWDRPAMPGGHGKVDQMRWPVVVVVV